MKNYKKMNKNSLPINLGLCFSLFFCLAFACNEGGEQRHDQTTKTTETKPPRTKTAAPADDEDAVTDKRQSDSSDDGLTEEIVKEKIAAWEERKVDMTGRTVEDINFKSIQFGKAEKPSSRDALQGATDVYYPVRVKYTTVFSDSSEDTYLEFDFYINSFNEWEFRWASI